MKESNKKCSRPFLVPVSYTRPISLFFSSHSLHLILLFLPSMNHHANRSPSVNVVILLLRSFGYTILLQCLPLILSFLFFFVYSKSEYTTKIGQCVRPAVYPITRQKYERLTGIFFAQVCLMNISVEFEDENDRLRNA